MFSWSLAAVRSVVATLCVAASVVAAAQESAVPSKEQKPPSSNAEEPFRMAPIGKNWVLELDLRQFKIEPIRRSSDQIGVSIQATNRSNGMMLSMFLEKAPKEGDMKACRDHYWNKGLKAAIKRLDIQMSERENMAIVEHFVEIGGKLRQKHLNAYLAHDGVWVDIHISKLPFKDEDQKMFNEILDSARFRDDVKPTAGPKASETMRLFGQGTEAMRKRDYKAAAAAYTEAVERERKARTIDQKTWRTLVNALGICHLATMEPKKAREVFEYGLSEDPNYAAFFYNLARIAALTGDGDKTLEHLRAAFENRESLPANESLADPRKDGAFKNYVTDERFTKLFDEFKI